MLSYLCIVGNWERTLYEDGRTTGTVEIMVGEDRDSVGKTEPESDFSDELETSQKERIPDSGKRSVEPARGMPRK